MNDDLPPLSPDDFAAALAERYQRLSLLTLDLAEEAGEAAVNFSLVDKADRPSRFERRIGAMTRAIWAHRVIERLRLGRVSGDQLSMQAVPKPEKTSVPPAQEDLTSMGGLAHLSNAGSLENLGRSENLESLNNLSGTASFCDELETTLLAAHESDVLDDDAGARSSHRQATEEGETPEGCQTTVGCQTTEDIVAAGETDAIDETDGASASTVSNPSGTRSAPQTRETIDSGLSDSELLGGVVDEAALNAAIAKALGEGKRGEAAFKAVLQDAAIAPP